MICEECFFVQYMVQPSISLQNLSLKVHIHSVANFISKRFKTSLLQADFKFLSVYICYMMYSIVSLLAIFVNEDSTS